MTMCGMSYWSRLKQMLKKYPKLHEHHQRTESLYSSRRLRRFILSYPSITKNENITD